MESPARILIIRPSALGDVCRTVPVLASLRRQYPEAAIDWLVQDSFAPAVASHPALTGVVAFPRREVALGRLWRRDARARLRRLINSLRDGRYDLVYDCQGLGRSGFFAWVTGAERRVGFADAREFGFLGVNERMATPAHMHSVDRMLALLEGSGVPPVRDMRLYTSADDRANVDERLLGARYAVIAPTSRWEGKRWPAERFAELVDALLAQGAVDRVAIVGSGAERAQALPVAARAIGDDRVVDLIGRTGVGGLMAVIEGSSLVVANDSAALHMAVGFDRALVALYGPTRVELVGPYLREIDVIQAIAPEGGNQHKDQRVGRKAMEAIDTARVIEAALSRLRAEGVAAGAGRAGGDA